MLVDSIDDLDDLSDDELWEVAANTRNEPAIRHDAIQRWLFPETGEPDDESAARLIELRERSTILPKDEVEEDNIEDLYRPAPYFDGEGRLIVEYNGVQYLIDSLDEEIDERDDAAV